MGWRLFVTLGLALLVPAAGVSAATVFPDPTWIGGVYSLDADELLVQAWDVSPASQTIVPTLPRPVVGTTVSDVERDHVIVVPVPFSEPRAPPVA